MTKSDEKSEAQAWELEVTCKNKKYLDKVVKAILKCGFIDFEVECVECLQNTDVWDGRYIVLLWASGFDTLASISRDLKRIEKKLGFI